MKRNRTKKSLLLSVISLLLCVSMFAGSTYAWFTDEVTSGTNQIIAGNLDVELYHNSTNATPTIDDSHKVTGDTKLFSSGLNGDILWEPGAIAVENFTVKNVGNLALKYELNFNDLADTDYNYVTWGTATRKYDLRDVIKVAVVSEGFIGDRTAAQALTYKSWEDFSASASSVASLKPGESKTFGLVLYWQPNDNAVDNLYNLKNGAYDETSNPTGWNLSAQSAAGKDELYLNLGVKLIAAQYTYESDSFDDQYDANATPAIGVHEAASGTAEYSTTGTVVSALTVDGSNTPIATTTVAAGTALTYNDGTTDQPVAGGSTLKLTVEETQDAGGNFVAVDGNNSTSSFEVTLETVTASGSYAVSSSDNAIITSVNIGVVDLVQFAHNGTKMTKVNTSADDVDTDGEYFYNQSTGVVTFATKTFSPFTAEYPFAGGLGTVEYPYLIETREHFEKMAEVNDAYHYFKMKDGIKSMDCSNWTPVEFYGSFDGNGVAFNNLDKWLFSDVLYGDGSQQHVKNFTVNANVVIYGYGAAAIANACSGNAVFENIDVNGYVEGRGNSSVFVAYGTWDDSNTIHFKNCGGNATLLVKQNGPGVYVGHHGTHSSVILEDCHYSGVVYSTNGKAYTTTDYTTSSWAAFREIENGVELPQVKYGKTYRNVGKINYNTPALGEKEFGDSFSITATEGSVRAVAEFMIAPNGNGVTVFGGSYTATYIRENVELVDGSYTTDAIRYYHVDINSGAASQTGLDPVTNTFHVVNNAYNNTYASANVMFTEYDAEGHVIAVTAFALPVENPD